MAEHWRVIEHHEGGVTYGSWLDGLAIKHAYELRDQGKKVSLECEDDGETKTWGPDDDLPLIPMEVLQR